MSEEVSAVVAKKSPVEVAAWRSGWLAGWLARLSQKQKRNVQQLEFLKPLG